MRTVVALVVVSVTAAGLAVAVDRANRPDAAPAATRPAPKAPVLSLRRAPELVARTVADVRITSALDAILEDSRYRASRECLVVEEGDRVLFTRDAAERFVPASTMKVLTGIAALEALGAEHTFRTEARLVDGRLWLVGGGDPLLATPEYAATFPNQPQTFTNFEQLAQSIVDAGVRDIPAGVWGDESRYDTERFVASWKPVYITENDISPVSALTVNDSFFQYRPLPRKQTDRPALHAAAVLTGLLRARGVTVAEPGEGVAPAAPAVASVVSPPLTEVVGQMLRESDNMTAELLVKEVGKKVSSRGTWPDGVAAIRETLDAAGYDADGYQAVDGSGLDVSDRLSCGLLMDALDQVGTSSAIASGFAVAGETGTLARRFVDNPAAGRLRAKTGSLNFVVGLTGFVDTAPGRVLEFALLANDLPDRLDSGRRLQESVGAVLATYPDAPTVEALAP